MKKSLLIVAVVIAVSLGIIRTGNDWSTEKGPVAGSSDQRIATAFQNHASNLQVEGEGTVIKVLSDDLVHPRHQRFILRLASGQTLLVAHNIDLAPRIEGLSEGDRVQFRGEYEWNDQGGVIHWTHHDPGGRHAVGWLKHQGSSSNNYNGSRTLRLSFPRSHENRSATVKMGTFGDFHVIVGTRASFRNTWKMFMNGYHGRIVQ